MEYRANPIDYFLQFIRNNKLERVARQGAPRNWDMQAPLEGSVFFYRNNLRLFNGTNDLVEIKYLLPNSIKESRP